MKKYNKSEIMKNAWNKFRTGNHATFADALSQAWRELKELTIMSDELQAKITALEDEIKAHMTAQDVTEMVIDIFKIRWTPVSTSRVDTSALKKELPDIAARFTKLVSTLNLESMEYLAKDLKGLKDPDNPLNPVNDFHDRLKKFLKGHSANDFAVYFNHVVTVQAPSAFHDFRFVIFFHFGILLDFFGWVEYCWLGMFCSYYQVHFVPLCVLSTQEHFESVNTFFYFFSEVFPCLLFLIGSKIYG